MTRPPHPTFLVRRRHLALIGLLAALLLWLPWETTSGQTTSVVVLNTYTTSAPGPAQVPVSQFPSGTSTVYFDYTVQTASPSDVGDVDVLINGTNGPYVATAPLDLKGTGNKFAALTTGSGIYPDGAYCLIMKIDGVPQTIVGGVPLAFRVGQSTYNFTCQNPPPDTGTPTETPTVTATPTQTPSATSAPVTVTPPTATPIPTNTQQVLSPSPVPQPTSTFTPTPTLTPTPTFTPTATPTATPVQFPTQIAEESLRHFVLAISSSMQVRHFGTLRLYIHGTQGRAVPGVSVHIDARGLGMIHQRNGTTNRFGLVTFTSLWPPHGGRLAISASKPSYDSVTVELGVG